MLDVIVYLFAVVGVANVFSWIVCNVWRTDDEVDVTRLDSGAEAATTTANNTREVTETLRDINSRVGSKPQPRKANPKAPSGKTARKRGTKSGK